MRGCGAAAAAVWGGVRALPASGIGRAQALAESRDQHAHQVAELGAIAAGQTFGIKAQALMQAEGVMQSRRVHSVPAVP